MNKHFRKISDYAMIGGLSAVVVGVLAGCGDTNTPQQQNAQATAQAVKNGAFVILEEQAQGGYKVLEEYPSDKTRIVVRGLDGQERILSDEEVQELLKEEERKIDNGTSELIAEQGSGASMSNGGMSLGGAILASAAGALIGSYIGNKLFNNPNFQKNQQRSYKSPQAYERSANNFNKSGSTSAARGGTPSNAKGGFFGGNQKAGSAGTSNTRSSGSLGG